MLKTVNEAKLGHSQKKGYSVETLRQLLNLLDTQEYTKIAVLMLMMVIGSALEVLGIGMILPFLGAITDPQSILDHDYIGLALKSIHITEPQAVIIFVGAILMSVFLLKSIYLVIQWRVVYGYTYRGSVRLAKRLLNSYLRSPYTFHLQHNTSDLIRNTIVEARNVYSTFLNPLMILFAETTVMFGLFMILFISNPTTTLGGFGLLGLVGWAIHSHVRSKLDHYGRVRAEQNARILQWVREGLGSIKELKVLGRESYYVTAFERSGDQMADALSRNAVWKQYPRFMLESALVIGFAGLVMILTSTGADLKSLLPTLALFAVATIRILPSVNRIVSAINGIRFQAPSVSITYSEFEKAKEASRAISKQDIESITFSREIKVDQVTFIYPETSNPSLKDLNLTISHGQSIGIVGPSGAGKTTLVNVLLGLLRPTSGHILVDGIDIHEGLTGWQRQIGYIPQDIYLSDNTIRANVAFGVPDDEIDDDAVWRAIKGAQLDSFARSLPNGLHTIVGDRGVRISGGQRQRIGIARALYHDPAVLIFDEATSSLDYETERRVTSAIDNLAGQKTLIIVTHRLNTVKHCDKIHALQDGCLVGSGTYNELLSRNSMFQQLVKAIESSFL